jgi:hypothetical protein
MRADAESQLVALGLLPAGGGLPLNVYSLARNIQSEAGSGSIAERGAMAQAALNRARRDGISISHLTMRNGTRYARQSGRNPRVASSQDPRWSDIVLAALTLEGRLEGQFGGVTHYFSPKVQDSMHAAGRTSSDRWAIYDRWARSWGYAWVGPIPGVDPEKQFLMVDVGQAAPGWADAYARGKWQLAHPRGREPMIYCQQAPSAAGTGWLVAVVGASALAAAGIYFYRETR